MDIVDQETRSRMMGRIRGKDTKPEVAVRRVAHALGYRFRLHSRDIPGTPDLAFPGRRKVVFVHGCYWHRHEGCSFAYTPKSNTEFWTNKFDRNVARDAEVLTTLRQEGWDSLIIWECQTTNLQAIAESLSDYLGAN